MKRMSLQLEPGVEGPCGALRRAAGLGRVLHGQGRRHGAMLPQLAFALVEPMSVGDRASKDSRAKDSNKIVDLPLEHMEHCSAHVLVCSYQKDAQSVIRLSCLTK